MSHGKSDAEIIRTTHNTARFFTENRQLSWVLLIATILAGIFGYFQMPKRKDPVFVVRKVVALGVWPGATADRVEQLITRRIEEKLAENSRVTKIESISRTGISVVYASLDDTISEEAYSKELDDLKIRMDAIHDLPDGSWPIQYIKDFGDTAALMLTVASPKVDDVEVSLRARDLQAAVTKARDMADPSHREGRRSLVALLPYSLSPTVVVRTRDLLSRYALEQGFAQDVRPLEGPGMLGIDGVMPHTDAEILAFAGKFIRERLHASEFHPDVWPPLVVDRPSQIKERVAAVAGDKYTYRELDDYTDLIKRTLQTVPEVSKVTRSGVLPEQILLEYGQDRLASYGVQPSRLVEILRGRNIITPGGMLEVESRNVTINPSGELKTEKEIGDILLMTSTSGTPVYLRDLVDVARRYESPARFLNYYTWKDKNGHWQRTRAVSLAVQMRTGQQIGTFAEHVNASLADLQKRLPGDLALARTSDQPLQVDENVSLFMKSLIEAIVLVVLVALIGFWEWRSAMLMALSIPITLAMTFAMMQAVGVDIQQVSVASLIIALGLLVDDPVVAGDAIKRSLDDGHHPLVAAWLGPTKLATAIMFATITNIVAYLPFLLLPGDVGRFVRSLPIVLTCSLIASRLVSMTFIPLLGYYLLRPGKKKAEAEAVNEASEADETPAEPARKSGFQTAYYRFGGWCLDHRWLALGMSVVLLVLSVLPLLGLRQQFFPKDLSYLSYVDVWLPEDAPLSATNTAVAQAEAVIRKTAEEYGKHHKSEPEGKHTAENEGVLRSLTSFVGGGGPRFWWSVAPELPQLNYAQLIIQVNDKHVTQHLVPELQLALSAAIPNARVDVRELESGQPVGIPVSVRISGDDIPTLRRLSEEVQGMMRAIPIADRVRDDWGPENFVVNLGVDSDRANLAGVTNLDVAASSAASMSGVQVSTLREGDKRIPINVRLRAEDRAQLSDIHNLYVHSLTTEQKAPLGQVSSVDYQMQTEKVQRRNQFRTVTVSCFPTVGALPTEVWNQATPKLDKFRKTLPPGYKMEIGGELEKTVESNEKMAVVMLISVCAIFLALVVQFRHAFKPFIVYAAIPYGFAGGMLTLAIMGGAFGFMAFLGLISLIGVIVSHVIVLFDFIEEQHAEGAPLREALLDAGIMRLRPVFITVGATVFGLVPLALHGGPLWEPLCYVQIGGLTAATVITLVLVPVLYTICVRDLKIVQWKERVPGSEHSSVEH